MNKFRSAILNGKGPGAGNPVVSEKQARGAKSEDLGSIEVERHEGRAVDHRDADRHRLVSESISVTYRGQPHDVELVNLSGGGAMIEAAFSPFLWERVDLLLGDGPPIECAVRWVRDQRIGLEFAHETRLDCDPAVRDALLLEVIHRSFPAVEAVPAPAEDERPAATVDQPLAEARRVERRHPLIWSGQIYWNHDAYKVRLRNIGASGALIDGCSGLTEGAELMLDLGHGVQVFATVVWARGEQAGLSFAEPFALERLTETVPDVAPRWVRPTFLDQRADDSDPWAPGWGRQSLSEIQDDLEGFLKR